eukprot:13263256-Ditylum_brightwellii.AAC.1
MAIVASNTTLYTTFMSKAEMLVAFSCTFQANVDMMNAHGGCAECGLDNNSNMDNHKKMVGGTRV